MLIGKKVAKNVFGDRLNTFKDHARHFDPEGMFNHKWLNHVIFQEEDEE